MKRTIKLSLCLLSALLTLLSCQEESIQADYQIIPLPQQIQLKSNEDPFIINIICDYFKCVRSTRFLIMSGQNPMIAYVATDLLIYPILNILGITPLLEYFYSSPWLGFLHGIILTSLTVFITMFFTRIKWYWRT